MCETFSELDTLMHKLHNKAFPILSLKDALKAFEDFKNKGQCTTGPTATTVQ